MIIAGQEEGIYYLRCWPRASCRLRASQVGLSWLALNTRTFFIISENDLGILCGVRLLAVCLGTYGSAAMSLLVKDFQSLSNPFTVGMVDVNGIGMYCPGAAIFTDIWIRDVTSLRQIRRGIKALSRNFYVFGGRKDHSLESYSEQRKGLHSCCRWSDENPGPRRLYS